LTCEETEAIRGKPHGYVFEVDPYDQEADRDPKPIKAFGRYAHESLVIDPRRHTVYLTEDATAPNGLLYRWTPDEDRSHWAAARCAGSPTTWACSRRSRRLSWPPSPGPPTAAPPSTMARCGSSTPRPARSS
jgi:hypothetical protein